MPASVQLLSKAKDIHRAIESVLAKWKPDQQYYKVDVLSCDLVKRQCKVKFEDKTEHVVNCEDMHVQIKLEWLQDKYIVCCVCDSGASDHPNVIIMCESCSQGFHVRCHKPNIGEKVIEDENVEWVCSTCDDIYQNSLKLANKKTKTTATSKARSPNKITKKSKDSSKKRTSSQASSNKSQSQDKTKSKDAAKARTSNRRASRDKPVTNDDINDAAEADQTDQEIDVETEPTNSAPKKSSSQSSRTVSKRQDKEPERVIEKPRKRARQDKLKATDVIEKTDMIGEKDPENVESQIDDAETQENLVVTNEIEVVTSEEDEEVEKRKQPVAADSKDRKKKKTDITKSDKVVLRKNIDVIDTNTFIDSIASRKASEPA